MKHIFLSKLLIAFMLCVINCSSLFAQDTITILNEKAGKFQKIVEKKWKKEKGLPAMSEVTHLSIKGVMVLIDKQSIQTLFPNLESLDLDGLIDTKEIKASDFCLDKLEVLYLPMCCTTFKCDYELKNIKKIYGYENLNITRYSNSRFPNIPFVHIKTEGDKNIIPEEIGWDVATLEQLGGSSLRINMLVSSMQYLTKWDTSKSKSARPTLHYDTGSKEVYLHNWKDDFSLDLFNNVDYIEAASTGKAYERAWKSFDKVDVLSFPSNLKSISKRLFSNSTIKEVKFGTSQIKIVPERCFSSCVKLRNIEFNNSVEEIDAFAFSKTAIEKITLPKSIKKINANAFDECKSLIEINMLSEVPPTFVIGGGFSKNLSHYIFELKKIVIRVPKGSYETYSNAKYWDQLNIVEDGVENKFELEIDEPGTLVSYIPLKSMPAIKSLTITGVLYDTDLEILQKMPLLKYLDLSQTLIIESPKTANERASKEAALAHVFSVLGVAADDAFDNGQLSSMEHGFAKMMVNMVNEASASKSSIESCYIPNKAFMNMKALEDVRLPLFANKIGISAFQGCVSLRSILIPLYLEKIYSDAFNGCINLQPFEIPSTINYIGKSAFSNCRKIASINLQHCVFKKTFNFDMFCNYTGKIIMPNGVFTLKGWDLGSTRPYMVTGIYDITFSEYIETFSYVGFANCELRFEQSTPPAKFERSRIDNCRIYVPKGSETAYYMVFGDSNKYIEME